MRPEAVTEAIAQLIEQRALKGNCQSKHGLEAAEGFELFWIMERLNELLGETP